VNQARALGEREAVELLQENLRQEKEALKKVETISKRLLKSSNGTSKSNGSARRSTRSRVRAKTGASR
jgi:ferritin-like metal-binding protein YciE